MAESNSKRHKLSPEHNELVNRINDAINPLKEHFNGNQFTLIVLNEALTFIMKDKKWNFCVWCCCGDRFGETELLMKHIIKSNHISNLPKKYAHEELEVADGESLKMVVKYAILSLASI